MVAELGLDRTMDFSDLLVKDDRIKLFDHLAWTELP